MSWRANREWSSALALLVLFTIPYSLLAAELPPMPPGKSTNQIAPQAVTPPAPVSGIIRLRVVRYTPQISRIEFYCVTNRPARWTLQGSSDLVNWRTIETKAVTNDLQFVPMLRDNAQLVTWLLVRPEVERAYYRLQL